MGAIQSTRASERMRAGLREALALAVAAGLGLGAKPALAQTAPQQAPPATTNTTAPSDSVGPRDLQNFSLGGTVTRRAEPPPAPAATTSPRATAPAASAEAPPRSEPASSRRAARTESADVSAPPSTERRSEPAASTTLASPEPEQPEAAAPTTGSLATGAPSLALAPVADQSNANSAPASKIALWPWLLAAVVLGAGGAFLFWRSRRQEAFAGGPKFDAFVASEPVARPVPRPAPKPAPIPPTAAPQPTPPTVAPPPASQPSIPGLVTTRLRPTIDILVNPLRFIVEDSRVALELEIELLNSGSAPAHGVLIEAALLNAGNEQDSQLEAFFANPVGEGQRIVVIPPMQRVMIKSEVAIPRTSVQEFEIAGKRVCVPLIALTALYKWNNKDGQTSVAYLIGRDTDGGKLAPFRLDLGPRLFRGVGLRELPNAFRK